MSRPSRVVTVRSAPPPVAALLLAVGVAQLADGITCLRMLADQGLAAERNPLVAGLAAAGAPGLLLVLKVALVIEVVAVCALLGRRAPVAAAMVAAVGMAAGLIGAFSNVAVLLAG